MTRLARLALHLYPLAHQRRYGDEMRALLDDRPPGARALLDLLRGALLAHLRPGEGPSGAVDAADRVRATASGVLLCWVFFAAAGFGFYKTTEDHPFSVAGQLHPVVRDAHLAVQALAVIASAAVALGALPLIAAALGHARREPDVRRIVALPLLPVIGFGALTLAVLAIISGQAHATVAGFVLAIFWGLAGLACGLICVLTCGAALFATPLGPSRLRATLFCGVLVTIAMFAITAATAIYAVVLGIDASRLASDSNGPFGVLSVTSSLIVLVIVMMGISVLAALTTRRGWRVRAGLETAAS